MLTSSIVVVGNFPPPVHGASIANAAMVGKLRSAGADPYVVDIAGAGASGSAIQRGARVGRVATGLARVVRRVTRENRTMYISVNGGLGQAYDVLFLLAAKARGARLFLHHHSYAYLDRRSGLTSLLTSVAGRGATHIVLCEEMSKRLRLHYPGVEHVRILSNSALIERAVRLAQDDTRPLTTIGFLGTISAAKGIGGFLDVIRKTSLQGIVAGPYGDRESETSVTRAISELPRVKYAGILDHGARDEFMRSIDVLLFPSSYVNEAEPLVVLEALAFGVPVIANARGCIREMLSSGGAVVNSPDDFVPRAVELLDEWRSSPELLANQRRAARQRFDDRRAANNTVLHSLLREMTSDQS